MWGKVAGPFREFGFLPGLLYAGDRVLRRISPKLGLYVYEMMVQPIGEKPLLSANLVKNLSFVEIGRGHPDVASMPARPEIKEARFDQGSICLGVYRRGVFIGFAWFCFEVYQEDEVRCTYELGLPAQSVFDFDFYVFPEHRMGVGFMAVWHGANQYLRARGVHYTFSRLTRFNTASRKAHAHLGWKCVGRAVFLQLWALEIMLSTLRPYVFLSWPGGWRPRLRLWPDVLLAAPAPRPGAVP